MAELFEPTVLNGMRLAGRSVRSATWEGLATAEGYATDALTKLLLRLVEGQVGLIITGHAYISPEGKAAPGQLGIHSDDHVPSLKRMVDKVHDAGGTIAVQINHGGRYALKTPGVVRIGPSDVQARGEIQCREMSIEEIGRTIAQFAEAAGRAKAAGFDAIQIHAAHTYLLSEFLSPVFNRRTDAYGGPVSHRARFLLEVLHAQRNEVGKDFPILVKLNAQDFLQGGFSVDDMLEVASLLQAEGVDAIEMSGGHHVEGVFGELFPARKGRPKGDEGPYYLDEARRYKEKIHVPLMLVGGIRSLEWAQRILGEGIADYISLSRPLIREPGLIKRWKAGDEAKSKCISDNGCFSPGLKGEGIYCTVAAKGA